MNEPAVNALPLFQPPVLSPRSACALNALLRCTDEKGILDWPKNSVCLRICAFPPLFTPGVLATLRWFEALWTVEIGGLDVVRIHPLLKDLPADTDIPEALRLAVLDMLVLAVLDALGLLGGAPQSFEYGFVEPGIRSECSEPEEPVDHVQSPEAATTGPFLWLELLLPDGAQFPVRVGLPEDDAPVQAMLSALLASAPDRTLASTDSSENHIPTSHLAVTIGVETGAMRLSIAECRELAVGDILLPDDYPGRENRVRLVFESRRPMPVLHCAVCGLAATIEHITLPTEVSMTNPTLQNIKEEPDNEHPDTAPATEGAISVSDIDLAVSFELERRLMTVAEVAALRPGHTVILTNDPLAPVTVRVQGKAIGTGRLVDLGGTLGVQITAIS